MKIQTPNKPGLIFTVLIVLLSVCSADPQQLSLDSRKLDALLTSIAPWPSGNLAYSDANWSPLVSAAKYIQHCDTESVSKTLTTYENRFPHRSAKIDLDEIPGRKPTSSSIFGGYDMKTLQETIETDGKVFCFFSLASG
jgi:hypothetical protein